jgi:ABC-type polysaccharide/polyol phosphate export permease
LILLFISGFVSILNSYGFQNSSLKTRYMVISCFIYFSFFFCFAFFCFVFFVFFFFFRLVYHMLSVSVECQFFITPSVFSKVYWNTVLDEVLLCFPISEIVDKLDERYDLINWTSFSCGNRNGYVRRGGWNISMLDHRCR